MSGLIGNSSDKQVLKNTVVITGLVNAKVLFVNPTKAELEKVLDVELEKEPQYTNVEIKQQDGTVKIFNKVSFLLEANPLVTQYKEGQPFKERLKIIRSFDILVQPEVEMSSTNKPKTINAKGDTHWNTIEGIKANEKMKWFIHEPLMECLVGQETLTSFMKEYLNISPKDNVVFADIKKICSGDVSELRKYVAAYPKNEVTVYMDIKEDGDKMYQTVYSKCFSRPTASTPENKFSKMFKEQYKAPKVFNGNFEPTAYISRKNGDAPDTEATKHANMSKSDFV